MKTLSRLAAGMLLLAGCTSSPRQQATSLPKDIRINCGASTEVIDAGGRRWMPDQGFSDGVATADLGRENATLPAVCRSERWGMSGFWIPLASGQYDVSLTFCESYSGVTAAGQRLFHANVEGVSLRDIDPFQEGGGVRKPSVRQVRVNVRDGKLDIGFEAVKQSPQINAIEIHAIHKNGETSAPAGFDQPRNVPRGHVTAVHYPSRTAGHERPANVYTPPGYDSSHKYPLLILLHGGPAEAHYWKLWNEQGRAATIMDNLIAGGKAEPMIVVMPLGAFHPPVPPTTGPSSADDPKQRHLLFEQDILNDLLPFIESHYSVYTDPQHRAIAGFSMGGGQVGWIGPRNPQTFAYLGMFSSGLLGSAGDVVRERFPDGKELNERLKLLWVSVGDHDRYYPGVLRLVQLLDAKGIHYHWQMQHGSHDWPVSREALYLFAQRLFH